MFNSPLILFYCSGASTLGILILLLGVIRALDKAPELKSIEGQRSKALDTSLTIIIPTYNEEKNIEDCLTSVIRNKKPCTKWEIIVADDNSEDNTTKKASRILSNASIPFQIINCGRRPEGKRWVGKNWPCSEAVRKVSSEWILFLDADVRLKEFTLLRALSQADLEHIDLLSLAPRLTCSCLSEWMVQPIMASLLSMGFPIKATNNKNNKTAFAAGPFMFFRHTSYKAIGGHSAIAGEVVEDLALARNIKSSGFNLRFLLGLDSIDLGMYSNLYELWEGWSKNWFIGLDRNIIKSLGASTIVFLIFTMPWIIMPSSVIYMLLIPQVTLLFKVSMFLSLGGIIIQYILRRWTKERFLFPTKYWWLMGIGGLIILFLGPTSLFRTITGRGWTWKGRSLA